MQYLCKVGLVILTCSIKKVTPWELRNPRVGDLKYWDVFETRFRALAASMQSSYPGLTVDVEGELKYYRSIRDRILRMTTDTNHLVEKALRNGENVLAEGANAVMLDMDMGTYPFVTSSSPTAGGVCTGLGLPPKRINEIWGAVKAYTTRVGEGPFPTELLNDTGKHMQKVGAEFGTTTGRVRRCGWLDVPQMRYSVQVNGYTALNFTKLDVLTGLPELKIGVKYVAPDGSEHASMPAHLRDLEQVRVEYETLEGWTEDISGVYEFSHLPPAARKYVTRAEELVGVPIRWIGVGNDSRAMIDRGALYVTLRKISLDVQSWWNSK